MGWYVFPCKPRAKIPLIEHGCLDATIEENQIKEWWTKWPDANIGVATGEKSGITVLDADGPEGIKEVAQLLSTTISQTGNGRQLFYTYHDRLKNSVKQIGSNLDVRNNNGYVIVPPSNHPNGETYKWISGPTKDLPPFPQELVVRATSARIGTNRQPKPEGWISTALTGLTNGNRNATFASVVGKLHHSGLDKATIWALLLPHAHSCDFEEKELNGVIQSITRYPTAEDGSGDNRLANAGIEFFMESQEKVSWIVDKVIPRNSLAFSAGLPETFKTWMTIDLAVECSRGGGLWLGLFPCNMARVLFVDQERWKGETQRRFKGVMAAKGLSAADLKDKLYIVSGTTTRLNLDGSYNAFRERLDEIRPDLIIVDSFATFHDGDENDRMSIQKVIERVKEIKREFNCAVMFIDHEGKAAYNDAQENIAPHAGRMVGSIGKVAAAESVLTVRRYDSETCQVFHSKSTMGPKVPSFIVHVTDVDNGIRVWGEGLKNG